jgi:hypothetical protein
VRCPKDMARHRQRLGLGEAAEHQCRVKAAAPKRGGIANSVGHQEQQRHARHRVHHEVEELFTAGVDPVQVFDYQH